MKKILGYFKKLNNNERYIVKMERFCKFLTIGLALVIVLYFIAPMILVSVSNLWYTLP